MSSPGGHARQTHILWVCPEREPLSYTVWFMQVVWH